MTGLAERLAGLSPRKRELLLLQVAAKHGGSPPSGLIPRLPRLPREANRFPVSAWQLREWILDLLQAGTGAYNVPGGGRLVGPLDFAALERAVQEVVRRHETLRTTFESGDAEDDAGGGEPLQRVAPELRIAVPRLDLSALPAAARPAESRRLSRQELAAPFDLARGPLLRVVVVRLSADEHDVLFTAHHIISDGWSMGVFLRELAAFYESCSTGKPSLLPELPVQYADFAAWQRRRLEDGGMEAQIAYWRQQLAGVPPLTLPTDHPRPPVQRFAGARRPFVLGDAPTARLRGLAQEHGASLFMAALAGFSALMARTSGQDDFSVGTFSGNRTHRELEGLIGFFINTLVLRLRLEGEPTFHQLVDRAREVTLEAFARQDVPFEKLLEVLRVERDLSRSPLFQVALVLQSFPTAALDLTGIRIEPVEIDHDHADFDLSLWLGEGPHGLAGSFLYSVALFEAATVTRLSGHLAALIRAALAAPGRPVSELPLLGAEERQQLLAEWAPGPPDDGAERCLHELIAERARITPGAPALEAAGASLTYAELHRRADQLAAHLRGLGVGPETLVGLAVERSPEMIVALLGVLAAGGAYLPLDPAYPQARLALMITDAAVPVLLTQKRLASRLPAGGARVVLVDREETWGEAAAPGRWSAATPRNAAYVIYTSGSTGRPKGVVIEHRSIAGYARRTARAFDLGPGDRVLQFASISFDVSGEEIYTTLAAGATLVLRPDDMAGSAAHFVRELARLRITVLDLPTAYWHELVEGLGDEAALPSCLRLVFFGGEKVLPSRVALWHERVGPGVRLLNTYGPTEATIAATGHEIAAGAVEAPLGRPIPGLCAYVLGRRGEPVPAGVAGELCLGSDDRLARGYLGRPDATAERFVPDPFGQVSGARLYRTGDLVRWRADGDLEFLGRVDQQIKVRGFRVELGEIEAALRAHPGVRDAAVAARRGPVADTRLVAYVVRSRGEAAAGAEASPLSSELRDFLLARLPEHMVPALFLEVPALPLTPSGKLDRRALPEPAAVRPDMGTGYTAPQTELERAIAAVWRELLGVERIGTADNFFDLGAHSLLLVRAHGRLRTALGRELAVLDLFRHPSVGALARHLAHHESKPEFGQVQGLAQQQRAAQRSAQTRQQQALMRLRRGSGPLQRKTQ